MSILRKAGQKDVVASPATESNVLDDILGGDVSEYMIEGGHKFTLIPFGTGK